MEQIILEDRTVLTKGEDGTVRTKGEVLDQRIKSTHDQKNEETLKHFLHHLKRLVSLGGDKVLISSDGRFGMNTQFRWTNDFVVRAGDKFVNRMGDHASTIYTLKEILEGEVKIRYRKEFHHGSFGVNKISIDEGTIAVPYKE